MKFINYSEPKREDFPPGEQGFLEWSVKRDRIDFFIKTNGTDKEEEPAVTQ